MLFVLYFQYRYCTDVEANLQELFRRAGFNICIGNSDDHFRNHGFLLTPKGWTLSLAYDMNPSQNEYQSLLISRSTSRADLDILLDACEDYMFHRRTAEKILSEVTSAVRTWPDIAAQIHIPTKELAIFRHGMKYRHHMKYRKRETKSTIIDRVSIHDRPPEADGTRFGDWEMDLIMGKGNKSAILTMCERSRNYLMMKKLPRGRNSDDVVKAVIELLWPYRKNVLTITTDNGSEFAGHKAISKELSTSVYFTDSFASWQKGAIENTNKLIRQYLPKGIDFNDIDDEYVKNVQYKINRRPREKHNFSTPKDEFFKLLL